MSSLCLRSSIQLLTNRGRLCGRSLTFGAQTGRGSERSCVIRRTTDYKCACLMDLVHQLALNADGPALPYLDFQILKLEVGQNLNQQRDYHTMKFGREAHCRCCENGVWCSYDKEGQWLSFDGRKVVHQVTAVTQGERFSITLFTLGKLERLTASDWDTLAKTGFPIYLYEPLPAKMRRLSINTNPRNGSQA